MAYSLSISTNPLINRFADPSGLIPAVADQIGVRRLQLTNEFIEPSWPAEVQSRLSCDYARLAARHGVAITSVCTGASTRLNNMGHPDPDVRLWTIAWMKRLASIAADLGAASMGSQFAILTYRDFDDPARRQSAVERALDGWCEIWEHAARVGLRFLFWEHMSIGREMGETLESCARLQQAIGKRAGLALKLMLDVDHGDVASGDPDDTNPYKWLERFAAVSPIIHMKQCSANKSGQWPFVEPYNRSGWIEPKRFLAALDAFGATDTELCIELAFREREPNDRQVVDLLRRSVDFWRPLIPN